MPGGLIQIMNLGVAGEFFTVPAEYTLWRGVFKKMSNFAIEPLPLTFKNEVKLGNSSSCVIERLGDFLCGVILEVTMTKGPGDYTAAYHPMEALFEEITLRIDGDIIDRHTSDWLHIYNTMHRPYDKSQLHTRLTNFDPEIISNGVPATQTFMMPLVFSFCRHPSGALPLIVLPHSEITLTFKLAEAATIGILPDNFEMKVYGHYCYVDQLERDWIASKPYDCVIEQVQTHTFTLPKGVPSTNGPSNFQAKLNFYHPVKCLYWFARGEYAGSHGRYFGDKSTVPLAYTADVASPGGLCLVSPISDTLNPILSSKILFNEQDRVQSMKGQYYNRVLPFLHCSGQPVPGVCMYPFGYNLEQYNPCGLCNFSTLDHASIEVVFKKDVPLSEQSTPTSAREIGFLNKMVVIAWGFNVLRIQGGRGIVAFR